MFWFLLIGSAYMVKRHEFKRCDQSGFCVRQRAFADLVDNQVTGNSTYSIVPKSWSFMPEQGKLKANLMGIDPTDVYTMEITFLVSNSFRLKIKEREPARRYEAEDFIVQDALKTITFDVVQANQVTITFGTNKMVIQESPFSLSVSNNNVPLVTFNERGYFYYEELRTREQAEAKQFPFAKIKQDDPFATLKQNFVNGMWEETFMEKTDSKPHGPSSIGLDISFPGSSHVYGLPEHASAFSLKTTRGKNSDYSDPYRLYNLDVFEYELDNPMALYGSVPFMISHKKGASVGVLWLNAAEMWVDVEKEFEGKLVPKTAVQTHWMTESGIVDLFFFLGPNLGDVLNSLTLFTGRPALPQYFATAYHQCRWNYNDEKDVKEVDANFDVHDIPYDVLWLDIEHTDGKRYFTWDSVKFSDPVAMQNNLATRQRKMVTIIDPHIKRDSAYNVFKGAEDAGLYVKKPSGEDFNGWCWPGDSSWIDYTNPKAREYWAKLFEFSTYKGSTPSLYTWNDMNEPSVFTGPEITMPKDMIHQGQWEHRDVHNSYGTYFHRATFEGHLVRNNNKDRPFILSRAFFIGTQKYGSIWTGDNMAQWSHLEASVPMLLTIGMSGIPFSGADVGGFFGNPEPELLARWYQVGSLQPFFRAHAHIDSKRREPWLFGEPWTSIIRDAIRRRYRLLPYIYTLFYEASMNGKPVMRPLVLEYPDDEATFGMDNQFMLGSSLLVKPVATPGQANIDVYLPKSSVWYQYDTFTRVNSGVVNFATPLDFVPVFLRGGSIVPRKDRIRRSSALTVNDPYTLIVALDKNLEAKGSLYVDDGQSFEYTKGKYLYGTFTFAQKKLSFSTNQPFTKVRFERIIVLGGAFKAAQLNGPLEIASSEPLTIKNPPVTVGESWTISFE